MHTFPKGVKVQIHQKKALSPRERERERERENWKWNSKTLILEDSSVRTYLIASPTNTNKHYNSTNKERERERERAVWTCPTDSCTW